VIGKEIAMWKKIVLAPRAAWRKMPGPAKSAVVTATAAFMGGFVPAFAAVVNDGSLPTYPAIPWGPAVQAGLAGGVRGMVGILSVSPEGIIPGLTAGGALIGHLMESPLRQTPPKE
jgi:hypothetical protein